MKYQKNLDESAAFFNAGRSVPTSKGEKILPRGYCLMEPVGYSGTVRLVFREEGSKERIVGDFSYSLRGKAGSGTGDMILEAAEKDMESRKQ